MRLKRNNLRNIAVRLVLLSLFTFAAGCTNTVEIFNQPANPTGDTPGTGDDPVDEPQPLDISGTWATNATVAFDSCGFDPPEAYEPVLIEESGSNVIMTFADADGTCEESVRTRDGDTVTLTRSDVLDLDGDFIRIDVNIVYRFTEDSFTGTVTQSLTDLGNVFSDLPCEIRLDVTGTRCDNCWTGCTASQDATGDVWHRGTGSSLHELAAR